MEIPREYGVATTILFPLVDRGTLDFEATPVTFVAGDTQISKDEGAFANTSNNPAHEGNGIYSLALTATEMQAARIVVTIIDSATKAWEDQAIVVATYGDASAQHAANLNDATGLGLSRLDAAVSSRVAPMVTGTAQAGAGTSITLAAGESATDDIFNGSRVRIVSGTGAGQSRIINDYTGSTKVASVRPSWTTNPDATSVYEIEGADARIGMWLAELVNGLVSGRVDADVGNLQSGVITSVEAPNLDAAVSSRSSHGDPDPSGFLDVAVSSRATPAQVNAEVDNALDTAIPVSPTADSVNERLKRLEEDVTPTRAGNLDQLDAAVSSRATPAQVNTEVDNALDTAIPVSPTADSVNERLKRLEEDVTPTRAGNLDQLDAAITSRSSHGDPDPSGFLDAAITSRAVAGDAMALTAAAITSIREDVIPKQNEAFTFPVYLVDGTDHKTPETGLTPSVTVAKDGAAPAAIAGTVAEIGNGVYEVQATAADMNAGRCVFRVTDAAAADAVVTIYTSGGV